MACILHIDRQQHWKGQQARTYHVVRYLNGHGHRVLLVCQPGADYERRASQDGIPVVPVDMRRAAIVTAVVKLARLLRRERVDLVDAHGSIDHQIVALAALIGRRPIVVRSKHNLTQLHSGVFSRAFYRRPLTHKVVAISEAVRRQLLRDGLDDDSIEVIHTAVDTDHFQPVQDRTACRKRFGLSDEHVIIGGAARLGHIKGIDVLIKAFAQVHRRHPQTRYLHAGKGPLKYKKVCLPLIREEGIPEDRMIFLGPLRELNEFYSALDIFCLPSRIEGLGMAALEAMASGLPVVASRVGGIPEAVVDGVTGLLVPPEDPERLVIALERLVVNDTERRSLGTEARQRMVKHFDLPGMVDGTEALYLRLLSGRQSTAL